MDFCLEETNVIQQTTKKKKKIKLKKNPPHLVGNRQTFHCFSYGQLTMNEDS